MKQNSETLASFVPTMSGREVVEKLDRIYPAIKTPLIHENSYQLLVATVLSAQCTDAQVNKVTGPLFKKFPTPESMSKARISSLESLVKSTGFYHVKSKRLKLISGKIVKEFGGKVPNTMERLLTLPGVGRKTANIVLSAGFDSIEGIAVDTHVKRLSKRIGLSPHTDPEKIESDLMKITPREMWPRLSLLLILHGRQICQARFPKCTQCPLSSKCLFYRRTIKSAP